MILYNGILKKLKSDYTQNEVVKYSLADLSINELVGQTIQLKFTKRIFCIHCQRSIKKTFGEGYCYPCFQKLARCDTCIVKPEKCHFHVGTCREPDWGRENCLIKHAVYLANTTGLKVGITRAHQKVTRWVDQGAFAAIVLFYTSERLLAGQIEVELAKAYKDRTDWRGLLTGRKIECDLIQQRHALLDQFKNILFATQIETEPNPEPHYFQYPVEQYLVKATSLNLDRQALIEGQLLGVRGQYLLFSSGGLNIRKFQGYEVEIW